MTEGEARLRLEAEASVPDAAAAAPVSAAVSTASEDPAWDAFLESRRDAYHAQASSWGRVKALSGWSASRIILREDEAIVGGGQMFHKRMIPFGRVGYMPMGPIVPDGRRDLVRRVLKETRELAGDLGLQLLAVQPPDDSRMLAGYLSEAGFRPSWLQLCPTATATVDLTLDTDELLARCIHKTGKSIQRSEREGMTAREGTAADLESFFGLHEMTARRQKFIPYPKSYFGHMWEILKPLDQIDLVVTEYGGEMVSALWMVVFGRTAYAKVMGWSGRHPEKRPNQALFWKGIRLSKAKGRRVFDFEGIDRRGAEDLLHGRPLPEKLRHSPDFLKLGFGGRIVMRPLAHDFVRNPVLRWGYRRFSETTTRTSKCFKLLETFRRKLG